MSESFSTVRDRILLLLEEEGVLYTSQITRKLGVSYRYVLEKLHVAKRMGLVRDGWSWTTHPFGHKVMVHVWSLTDRGRHYVKDLRCGSSGE